MISEGVGIGGSPRHPMGKRHGESRQTSPSRARSQNDPDGNGNDPKTDWSWYNKGRRPEGKRIIRRMRRMAEIARGMTGMAPGTRDRRASAMTASTTRSEENPS